MAITLKSVGNDLLGGIGGAGEALFGAAGYDPSLETALPAEAELRNKLNFANIRISFPTTAGKLPFTNFLSQTTLSFPAYLTRLTDNFSPSFSGVSLYGRTDKVPQYSGTARTIVVSLTIPCLDAQDANENLKKINQFIKNIYPSYNSVKGDLIIASPPLVRVKFANLIIDHKIPFRGLLGYITSFSYTFDPKDGFFFNTENQLAQNLFFRSYSLNFTMSVLHESVVGFKDGEFNSNTDYPYRLNNNVLSPIQSNEKDKKFSLSNDLDEARLLR